MVKATANQMSSTGTEIMGEASGWGWDGTPSLVSRGADLVHGFEPAAKQKNLGARDPAGGG